MRLTAVTVYPVKSCAGISVQSAQLDRFGLHRDRRWMIVDEADRFVTQRDEARMSQIYVSHNERGLHLEFDGAETDVAVPDSGAEGRQVWVWDDRVAARDAGDDVGRWLSQRLDRNCRLVFMPDDVVRRVDGAYASAGETVGFADGFPLLLISQESLDDLNRRLPVPVPMNRFRPNLVVSGAAAFAEDEWRRIRIGAMEFEVAKACSRCVMPSIIQETSQRDPQINRTLASFRRSNGQIYFGQNLLYQETGKLSCGDPVEVLR